jgi:hypothetical protein
MTPPRSSGTPAIAQVLNGPTGDKCDAQIVSSTVRPIAGSCQSAATGSQNFTRQAAAY